MGVSFVNFLTNERESIFRGPIRQSFDELGKKLDLKFEFVKELTDSFDD